MLYTLLKFVPGGENFKVFVGVSIMCGLAYVPLYRKGVRPPCERRIGACIAAPRPVCRK